jgi:peptidoglycan/xylan/chitin deacetylase (PgdA/CDA1 family)
MRSRFNVVPLAELHRLLMNQESPPMRTVAITFDDCYRDNLAAAQVLAEHRLPATFFIPTHYIGSDHVFAWDADLPRMANLDWRDVAEMQALGHEIASHSVSHPDMGMIDVEDARRELTDSKKTLEDKLQRPVRWFAYPYGAKSNFKPEYLPLVYDAGYQACFSAIRGFIEPTLRGQILPREAMPNFRSMTSLELYLSGVLEWYYGWKGILS